MKKISARWIVSKSSFAIKATTVFVLCFFVYVCTHAQFKWLNPKPSGYDNISVIFISPQTGYLLNTNGDLFKTGDAGSTWQLANSFARPFCMKIADSIGVIGAANGTVFVSSDNGSNWQQLNTGINDNFGTVNMVSRDTFFLTSTTLSDVIYETTDRGITWATLHCGVPIHAISFANGQVGFVGSSQMTIRKTTDGGITWKTLRQSGLGISVNAIQFLNTDTGFVAREDSLLVTHDGGSTFSSYSSFGGATLLCFLNAADGWCAGNDGIILATHDGGKTATNVSFNARESNSILSFSFLTSNTGFAVGMFGQILKTINGGTNWALYSSPAYVPVTATAFGSASTGYATTRNNVYKTTDTGNTWQQLLFTTGNTTTFDYSVFEKAWFANADTGLLTSSIPAAIHVTTDGGNHWTTSVPATSFMMTDVSDVQFLNKKVGFMALIQTEAGKSGGILKTADGGLTWQLISGGGPYDPGLDHIFFTDEKTGFGSSYATLYKTTDSSKTWTQVYASPQFAGFTSLVFTSPDKGFISDDQGYIIKTTDSGKTWVNSSTPLTGLGGIGTLKFYNGQVGYITTDNISGPGNYGGIYQTIDSGATWQFKKNVGGSGIIFTPDTVVVVSGYASNILASKINAVDVDSVAGLHINNCSTTLTAGLSAVMCRADSITFEVTAWDGTVQLIPATPYNADNKRVTCTAEADNLIQDTVYTVRVRYKLNGSTLYSDKTRITAFGKPEKPLIKRTGDILSSNYAANNQWYRNDTLIIGETQQTYKLTDTVAACYTVTQTNSNGCVATSAKTCVGENLPVQLINLTATYTKNGTLVAWQTVSETNTAYFEVQVSRDGFSFSEAGTTNAAGNSNKLLHYAFTDAGALQAQVTALFYRIVTVDKDGKHSYSNIVAVNRPQSGATFTIAPNPSSTFAAVFFKSPIKNGNIVVYDQQGRRIMYLVLKNVPQTSCQLQTNTLPAGVYTVVVNTTNGRYTGKLVVAR